MTSRSENMHVHTNRQHENILPLDPYSTGTGHRRLQPVTLGGAKPPIFRVRGQARRAKARGSGEVLGEGAASLLSIS